MPSPSGPPSRLLQQVWDTAAKRASQGAALPAIAAGAVHDATPRLDAETQRTVPARGRTFWWSLAKAVAWGAAAVGSLLVIGSFGARPVPALKVAIILGVMIWAIGFGIFAGNQQVRERRLRLGAVKRAEVERVSEEAARYVWAAQVPGTWQPLGPAPEAVAGNDKQLPTAWLRRFGVAATDAVGLFVDGSESGLRRAIGAARGLPVVGFVAEPGSFTDEARAVADICGIGLFVVGRAGLQPMSHSASEVMKVYRDPAATAGPVDSLLARWADATESRGSVLTTSAR